ncbi:MAG: amino acid adenylation domain-containing protein, partial [Gammaproteobacteria bacterium]|nr:amino acid adenylation domain-containing protein [Gammaproteobacteria bacterium]
VRTAESFIEHPYRQGARLYRTGDRGRTLPDGTVEFLGRGDDQVKLRGFRIELKEIESVLLGHEGVREAVVLCREDAPGHKRLVAYVVGAAGAQVGAAALKRHAESELPAYMVPGSFVVLERLPLNATGKVDRAALPTPEQAGQEEAERFLAPRSQTEQLLAGIFADVLGVERVGVDDDFFELGGHSLFAMQLVGKLKVALGVDVPIQTLLESPTVARLAREVDARRASPAAAALPDIVPVPRTGALPLSFAQERLWFLSRLIPDSAAYNVAAATAFDGDLRLDVLRRALREIVARHEILRTVYREVEGRPVQSVCAEVELAMPVVDLTELDEASRDIATQRIARCVARAPFSVEHGPLYRLVVVELTEGRHVLLSSMHHIVSDIWSRGVLIRETALLYRAFADGAAPPLPPLPVQYADFAAWQRRALDSESFAEQLSYWTERLRERHPLPLQTDRPRPLVQSFRGRTVTRRVPDELARALSRLGRKYSATPFMTLLAALQAYLHRLTGSAVVDVGSPVMGRSRAETQSMIGFFLNTLVLRADLAGDPTFRELLKRVRQDVLDAFRHQDVPFEKVVEALQPERSTSRSPLFQVAFVMVDAPAERLELPGVSVAPLMLEPETAKYDLSVFAVRDGARLSLGAEYCTDLFDESTIARMLEGFEALLAHVAREPDARVSALDVMTEAERGRQLVEWNATARRYDLCRIDRAVADAAARAPDAVAVAGGGEHVTYAELERRAADVAQRLRAVGVGTESRVAVCIERSPALAAGLLGVLKAGAAYVPLDTGYPAERLAYMVRDAAPRALLTEARLLDALRAGAAGTTLPEDVGGDALPASDGKNPSQARVGGDARQASVGGADLEAVLAEVGASVVRADETGTRDDTDAGSGAAPGDGSASGNDGDARNAERASDAPASAVSGLDPHRDTDAESAAYVIYTSGSTGRPKGVVVPHSAVMNHMRWLAEEMELGAGDRVLQKTPLGFDAAGTELWAPLIAGGAVLMAEPGGQRDAGYLVEEITRERATVLQLVPSLLRVLPDVPDFGNCRSLRHVLCAGEALDAALASACARCGPPAVLHNLYGPTEAAIDVSHWRCDGRNARGVVPIGRPLPNTQLYVLDRQGEPVPVGAAGELCIGGANLARGYHGRADLTAERFVPDPFTAEPGRRMYRSGDRVRFRADGVLEYLGRIDRQVKLRGVRIELEEIEAVLGRHPGVRECAVRLSGEEDGDGRLVAYVVPVVPAAAASSGTAAGGADLRAFLKRHLPDTMLPAAYVSLDALPLGPNGKVDRNALPVPGGERPDVAAAYVEPRTAT